MEQIQLVDRFLQEKHIAFEANVPMKEYTSFRIGGPCLRMIWPASTEEIRQVVRFCKDEEILLYLMGNGSNLLVSDEGIGGVVLQLGKRFSGITQENSRIFCEAGASLAKLCVFAKEKGLTGLEFAYGIPGSVGGAAYMNAGAYGGEMKDVIEYCEHITPEGEMVRLTNEELGFSYRKSIYSGTNDCITNVCFRLHTGDRCEIEAAMDDYMTRRRTKQPLEYPSAGSTFKRPEGDYASALIDRCGLKGMYCGGAQVSEKHAGFIINFNDATCADVTTLMKKVKIIVEQKTGFVLEPEVKRLP